MGDGENQESRCEAKHFAKNFDFHTAPVGKYGCGGEPDVRTEQRKTAMAFSSTKVAHFLAAFHSRCINLTFVANHVKHIKMILEYSYGLVWAIFFLPLNRHFC
jgi:hypothetical protein